jgi:uncharacterized protein YoxC
MFLGLSTLVVAILISVVAAYYSVLGLTAIFAAAFWPIVIMGGALEVGKIMTAVWLHRNWSRASWAYKSYLVPALIFLMLLTSMGIFGFLSKAHLDQAVPTGDVAAQVALIDEKINNERDTIANARTLLGQMDRAVTDIGNAPDREVNGKTVSSAERALQVRRQQARDRASLTKTIEDSQARIVKLQEEKAPFAKDLRKIEAEVGPVKYVAALIYGDNPDTNTLEKAVRWVIILIVLVFDPLAIVLILAGSKQIEWAKGIDFATEDHHREVMRKKEIEQEESVPLPGAPPPTEQQNIEEINDLVREHQPDVDIDSIVAQAQDIEKQQQEMLEQEKSLIDELQKQFELAIQEKQMQLNEKEKMLAELNSAVDEIFAHSESLKEQTKHVLQENSELTEKIQALDDDIKQKDIDIGLLEQEILSLQQQIDQLHQQSEPTAAADYEQDDGPLSDEQIQQIKDTSFDFGLTADNVDIPAHSMNAGFGNKFPNDPAKGDLFLRVDYLPTKLFKWNGTKWIEIDKKLTDSYTYNEKYIEHLIGRLEKGEYDSDDLSDNEKQQIEEYLKNKS